jgi:16S rRNA G966 N2-methylase RsmD
MYSYDNLNKFMSDYKNGKIQFPYKRMYKSDVEIKKMFANLKKADISKNVIETPFKINNVKINSNKILFLGTPHLIINYNAEYEKYNISDMFQEENRMKCKFFSAVSSPLEYYNKNIEKLARQTIAKGPITPNLLREELYFSIKECSAFKPTNMTYIIKLLNIKSVLDPSSGWGDRLVAAMATDIRYVGVDPNTDLHPVYDKMIKFFGKSTKKYTMIENTIQEAKLPNEKFDMVFTSPPYFKIEQYNNRGRIKDVDEHQWFENFMKPMINKTVDKLNNGGYLVLVINQLPHEQYIKRMIQYIYDNKLELHYFGVIGYVNEAMKNPQPMWIWGKCPRVPKFLYNPPMVITQHTYNKIKFSVFRDDALMAGTKQRAIVDVLQKINKKKFIYAGPVQGFAQIALAYGARLTHKTAVLFLIKQHPRADLTQFALTFDSVELHEIENGYLKKLQECAEKYHKENSDSYLLSFGCGEKTYADVLKKNIKESIPKNISPKRIWIVAGSATVLNALYNVFPKTYFMVVQVGKKIWDDQLDLKRTTLFISDEKYVDIAKELPPYPTVATYDGKLWVFFKKHGKPGDYIYNIAKDKL